MITKCPECELPVSSHAAACPHCGYPLKTTPKRKRKSRRRRLPNGFGQITEIKGQNLRKPFRAMVTVGKTPEGKPISKLLKPEAYFETYNDAYQALSEYHRHPYVVDSGISVKELFDKWDEYRAKRGEPLASQLRGGWKYCWAIYDVPVRDLRIRHVKGCIEDGYIIDHGVRKSVPPSTKGVIKTLFNQLLDYGMEFDIVDRNCARDFAMPKTIKKEIEEGRVGHITFEPWEMDTLWANCDSVPDAKAVLVQAYMGLRPQELCLIEVKNLNLSTMSIVCGMKNDAGRNRTIPVHSKIQKFILEFRDRSIALDCPYLITAKVNGNYAPMNYEQYSYRFEKVVKALNLNPAHRPHDPRVFFTSQAKEYKVDEYALKRMLGHRIKDITESVYTKRPASWLRDEIEKIK